NGPAEAGVLRLVDVGHPAPAQQFANLITVIKDAGDTHEYLLSFRSWERWGLGVACGELLLCLILGRALAGHILGCGFGSGSGTRFSTGSRLGRWACGDDVQHDGAGCSLLAGCGLDTNDLSCFH